MIVMNNNKIHINESTNTSSGSRGSYVTPLSPGVREFDKSDLEPFTIPVSKYINAMLEYDSYDGKMDTPKKKIKKIESKSKRISDYLKNHPELNDDEGGVINQFPGKKNKIVPLKEMDTTSSAGAYNGPLELGMKKWESNYLEPFTEFVNTEINHKKIKSSLRNNIKRVVGVWEKNKDGSYTEKKHKVHTINEHNTNKKIIRLNENELLMIIKEIIKEIK